MPHCWKSHVAAQTMTSLEGCYFSWYATYYFHKWTKQCLYLFQYQLCDMLFTRSSMYMYIASRLFNTFHDLPSHIQAIYEKYLSKIINLYCNWWRYIHPISQCTVMLRDALQGYFWDWPKLDYEKTMSGFIFGWAPSVSFQILCSFCYKVDIKVSCAHLFSQMVH